MLLPSRKALQKRNEKFAVKTEMRDYEFISIEKNEKCTETY